MPIPVKQPIGHPGFPWPHPAFEIVDEFAPHSLLLNDDPQDWHALSESLHAAKLALDAGYDVGPMILAIIRAGSTILRRERELLERRTTCPPSTSTES